MAPMRLMSALAPAHGRGGRGADRERDLLVGHASLADARRRLLGHEGGAALAVAPVRGALGGRGRARQRGGARRRLETPLWTAEGGLADQVAERTGKSREEVLASTHAKSPIGRMAREDEIAAAIVFLCSEPASNVVGRGLVGRRRRDAHDLLGAFDPPRAVPILGPVAAVPYTIRRSDRARHARILVGGDGVEVVVPKRFPLREVEPFVEEKRPWIERTLRRMRESEIEFPPARLEDGGELPYLGERLALRVRERGRTRAARGAARRRAARGARARRSPSAALEALVPAPGARRGGARLDAAVARAGVSLPPDCRSAASARAGRAARRPGR